MNEILQSFLHDLRFSVAFRVASISTDWIFFPILHINEAKRAPNVLI